MIYNRLHQDGKQSEKHRFAVRVSVGLYFLYRLAELGCKSIHEQFTDTKTWVKWFILKYWKDCNALQHNLKEIVDGQLHALEPTKCTTRSDLSIIDWVAKAFGDDFQPLIDWGDKVRKFAQDLELETMIYSNHESVPYIIKWSQAQKFFVDDFNYNLSVSK